jgi:hypothetical protein
MYRQGLHPRPGLDAPEQFKENDDEEVIVTAAGGDCFRTGLYISERYRPDVL